jgi:hypothetical protein
MGGSMGRVDPNKPYEAAEKSRRFTTTGLDLYHVLLFSPQGATTAALMQRTHLMSLSYVRAQVADRLPTAEQLAAQLRDALREAAARLADPSEPGVDRATAARLLLGLESGWHTMSRADRRARAALALRVDARTLTKTRYESPSERYRPSRELQLLGDLGRQVDAFDLEHFRRQPQSSGDPSARFDHIHICTSRGKASTRSPPDSDGVGSRVLLLGRPLTRTTLAMSQTSCGAGRCACRRSTPSRSHNKASTLRLRRCQHHISSQLCATSFLLRHFARSRPKCGLLLRRTEFVTPIWQIQPRGRT